MVVPRILRSAKGLKDVWSGIEGRDSTDGLRLNVDPKVVLHVVSKGAECVSKIGAILAAPVGSCEVTIPEYL